MEHVKSSCCGEHELVALGKGQHTSNLEGGRMIFKPRKSPNIVIRKGTLMDVFKPQFQGEDIPII